MFGRLASTLLACRSESVCLGRPIFTRTANTRAAYCPFRLLKSIKRCNWILGGAREYHRTANTAESKVAIKGIRTHINTNRTMTWARVILQQTGGPPSAADDAGRGAVRQFRLGCRSAISAPQCHCSGVAAVAARQAAPAAADRVHQFGPVLLAGRALQRQVGIYNELQLVCASNMRIGFPVSNKQGVVDAYAASPPCTRRSAWRHRRR